MRISCLQENLNQGLNISSHISDKNTNLPILNNILIKTDNKNIKLISTNLEIGINCNIRGKVEDEGEITIPARILSDYVNLLPNDKVDLELFENELTVKCSNFITKIKGSSASDFPLLPSVDKENSCSCKVSIYDFRKVIQQVIFAISTNESRPDISGIFISIKGDILTMAATDSFRLAEKKIKIISSHGIQENINTILPYKTLNELMRILSNLQKDDELSEDQDHLIIYINENQVLFSCRNIELISRIIDAKYPDYSQIIPQEFKTKAIIDAKTLINSVKAASIFTKVGLYDIFLSFNSELNKIKISSLNSPLGESNCEIDSQIEGEKEDLILNYRYLLDGLQNIHTEKLILKITDKIKPCILMPYSEDASGEANYIYLIMPIKQ